MYLYFYNGIQSVNKRLRDIGKKITLGKKNLNVAARNEEVLHFNSGRRI